METYARTGLILLALLLPTWGWAMELLDEPYTSSGFSWCSGQPGQAKPCYSQTKEVLKDSMIVGDKICLAKMQAAMDAMEPFLLLNFEGTFQVNLNIVQPDQFGNYWAVLPAEKDLHTYTPYGLTQLWNVKAARAIVLWDQAKRDCWRSK